MFRSPNDSVDEIQKSIEYLDSLWKDEDAMQETINPKAPDFLNKTGDEYRCWQNHEANMMRLERIKRQLDRLREYSNNSNGIQIPFG